MFTEMSRLTRSSFSLSGLLFLVLYVGWLLLSKRNPQAPWLHPLGWAILLGWFVVRTVVSFMDARDDSAPVDRGGSKGRVKEEALLTLLAALCGIVIWYFRDRPWAPIATGLVAAIYFRGLGRLRERSVYFIVVGWIGAGAVASSLDWPYDQKFELVFVLGGLATAVQQAWRLMDEAREARADTG